MNAVVARLAQEANTRARLNEDGSQADAALLELSEEDLLAVSGGRAADHTKNVTSCICNCY